MKNFSRSSSSSGFTLVELLVVIGIIAILASVIIAATSGAINSAKRVQGSNMITQIQTGILNYQTEYGVLPLPSATAGAGTPGDTYYNDTDEADWQPLMYALCGNQNASQPTNAGGASGNQQEAVPNTRDIPFITPRRSDVDTNGILINPFTTRAATPATYFFVAMDADYDGIVGDSGDAAGQLPDFVNWATGSTIKYMSTGATQSVAVWGDCDPQHITTPTASTSPHFWVHTY